METIGYWPTHVAYISTISAGVRVLSPDFLNTYFPVRASGAVAVPSSSHSSLAATSSARHRSCPAL